MINYHVKPFLVLDNGVLVETSLKIWTKLYVHLFRFLINKLVLELKNLVDLK